MFKGHTLFGARRSRVEALYNDTLAWDRTKSRPVYVTNGRRQIVRRKAALRKQEIQRNALSVNADLKAGLPRLSNMVVRGMLHAHREECRIRTAMVEAAHEAGADGICPWLGDLATLF